MRKGNHRKHKRKTNRGDRDGGGQPALLPFEKRTDAGGQKREHRNQPKIPNNPDEGGHGQTYRSLHSGLFPCSRRWVPHISLVFREMPGFPVRGIEQRPPVWLSSGKAA